MHGSFRDRDPLKNGKGAYFYILGEAASADQSYDLCMITSMDVMMTMVIMLMISMVMVLAVIVMVVSGFLTLVTFMATYQKAPAGDSISVSSFESTGWEIDFQILKSLLKNLLGNSQIPESGNRHVAAYSGKGIDMKEFHNGWGLLEKGKNFSIHSHLLSFETAMQKKPKHHVAKTGKVCFNFLSQFSINVPRLSRIHHDPEFIAL
jgi:hypothetical protein